MAYTITDAQLLLKALRSQGINIPNTNQAQLSLLAWLRQENGPTSNPLGIKPFGANLGQIGLTSGGFGIFPSEYAAFQAVGKRLTTDSGRYGYGYTAIVNAFNTGSASNILSALALSKWDAGHYGLTNINPKTGAASGVNKLFGIYNTLAGVTRNSGINPAVPKQIPISFKSGDTVVPGQDVSPGAIANSVVSAATDPITQGLQSIGTQLSDTFTWIAFIILGIALLFGGILLLGFSAKGKS